MTEELQQNPGLDAQPQKKEQIIAEDSLHMKTGETVDLTEKAPALRSVLVGLGWDAPEEADGFDVDIDASAFLLNPEGKVRQDTDFIFYNNPETDDCIRHAGDNRTGEGEGDDEAIHISLEKVPFDVETIAFAVSLHNSEERQQSFGLVSNAYIRIVDEDDGTELAHFDLTEDAEDEDAMIFGELVRDDVGSGWRFKALGTVVTGGLYRIAQEYGVNVAAP